MLTGMDLIKDVNACEVAAGQSAFWWLGQHSYIVKLGPTVLYLDPYLTPGAARQVEPLLRPDDIDHADFVLGTHDHLDHIDRAVWPAIAQASPQARFLLPGRVRDDVQAETHIPDSRLVAMEADGTVAFETVAVTPIPAAHEFLDADPKTGQHRYLGYLIKGNGCTLYHAGDTCLYEGLAERLRLHRPDVLFLPINGRDAERYRAGCLGNMTFQEAADLAGPLAPRMVVPAHFDMFANNSEDPQRFVDYMAAKYPGVSTVIPAYGARSVISMVG